MDSIERFAYYLETDLGECATISLERVPQHSGAGWIRIDPFERDALPLAIFAGRDEIPYIEFGDVADHECIGNARFTDGTPIGPVAELGLMISAVALHGAALHRASFGRRSLHLGRSGPPARTATALHSWPPIHAELGAMLTFMQPPDYALLRPGFLRVPARRPKPLRRSPRETGTLGTGGMKKGPAGGAARPSLPDLDSNQEPAG